MRSVSRRKNTLILFFGMLILLKSSIAFSQTDSTVYWKNAILKAPTEASAVKACENAQAYISSRKEAYFIDDAYEILKASAQCSFSKHIFYNVFSFLEGLAKKKKLETEFSIFAIRLESNNDFQNEIVQNQLYYYYAQLYFKIKEFYNAEKYSKLFLSKGQHSLPENIQEDGELNAMTINALIDQEKNDFSSSLEKLKIILDRSISRKRIAWIGITKGNIAYILFQQGKYIESIPYLNEDVRISLQFNELASAMNSYITLKDIYLKLKQPDLAYKYLDSAHLLLKKMLDINPDNSNDLLIEGYQIHTSLADMYFEMHNYEKASEFYNRAFLINVNKEEQEKANQIKRIIESIEINRDLNKINELHEEVKHRKDLLLYSLIITIGIIGILIVYIIFYRRLKKANKSLMIKTEIIKHQNFVLEKINNDKDRLFSIISHDLRGPSNNLHAIFKAVADKKLPASTLEEQLPNIVKNSTNLINTLESLLTWSVSQLKGIIANKEKVDIMDSINTNILHFEDLAHKKSIQLLNHCHSKMVLIDKNHLEIILRNFTSNAIKFSKQNSTIQFDQIKHADYVEIAVRDHGAGLTDEQINNIMNSTAMKSTIGTSGEKGIGLGLLLTKEFIETNGGVLKIKSHLNEGTTMSFTIPKAI